MVIVVTGVAGVGKSTVGRLLAETLGWPFRDADEYHGPASIARMRGGEALREEDRGPWLAALAALIREHARRREPLVLASSALRREHRRVLLGDIPAGVAVRLVYLEADPAVLAGRIEERRGHFFPVELLADQLATVEPPGEDEPAAVLRLDASQSPAELVSAIRVAFDI